MTRSNRSQSKHDKKVECLAKNLERQGFDVQADIKGETHVYQATTSSHSDICSM